MAIAAGYLALSVLRKAPVSVRGFEMRMPPPSLALGQLLLSMADWALAAAVMHALLPAGGPPYGVLLGAFLASQVLGLVSHVPGGLGVFEGAMVLALGAYLPADRVIAALLLYRSVYYVLPLTLALLILLADEVRQRREQIAMVGRSLGELSVQLAPRVLAAFTFVAGFVLLVSGATPAKHERLYWLARFLPTGLFEVSHFIGSIVGVGLLVIAQAVSRRIHAAYYLVLAALAAGIAASLLKAADWEEALLLSLLLLVFLPSRAFFDRPAALFDTRFSPGWIVATVGALATSVWVGLFAFNHVEYSHDVWWQVAVNKDVPRFLRASLGAAVALLWFGLWRLLSPKRHIATPPSDAELADAGRIIDAQSATLPLLVYMRDKAILFDEARNAFIMYGVRGRTWVALGDPVGPRSAVRDMIRAFVERSDDLGGVPVFYQVEAAHLHLYADLGMTFAKLGEEARVSIDGFSLEGSRHKDLRGAMHRMERDQVRFRLLQPAEVSTVMPQLKSVSDDWLSHKAVSEKGFSLGAFDPAYLSRFPVAVLERDGRILAFANVLSASSRDEFSIDLMRFAEEAPSGAMDCLFTHLLLWGRSAGYRWFNLGMAPLSGLQHSPIAPAWTRLGGFLYQHGEAFYNFGGLREYKEKFDPSWSPLYLAYPAGFALPLILTDIAALSAGGFLRIFR